MDRIRILLADDHDQVRVPMRARLSREADFEIVAEAATSESALKAAMATAPGVVLMDPIMRDGRGLVALTQIAQALPQAVLIALTAYSDTALQMELRRMGVASILDKGIESQKLVSTIRECARAANHRSSSPPSSA
jgi:DNA-binding NarL/FixJ family response regulator